MVLRFSLAQTSKSSTMELIVGFDSCGLINNLYLKHV